MLHVMFRVLRVTFCVQIVKKKKNYVPEVISFDNVNVGQTLFLVFGNLRRNLQMFLDILELRVGNDTK